MFIVIRKTASLGHDYDSDDYRDHSVIVCDTLEQAVAEYLDWCNLPPNKFGHNHAVIFRNSMENDHAFIREVEVEKKRQRKESPTVDVFKVEPVKMASFEELLAVDEDYTPDCY